VVVERTVKKIFISKLKIGLSVSDNVGISNRQNDRKNIFTLNTRFLN
jgi:hypothetical protein